MHSIRASFVAPIPSGWRHCRVIHYTDWAVFPDMIWMPPIPVSLAALAILGIGCTRQPRSAYSNVGRGQPVEPIRRLSSGGSSRLAVRAFPLEISIAGQRRACGHLGPFVPGSTLRCRPAAGFAVSFRCCCGTKHGSGDRFRQWRTHLSCPTGGRGWLRDSQPWPSRGSAAGLVRNNGLGRACGGVIKWWRPCPVSR